MTPTRYLSTRRAELSPAKRDLLQKRINGAVKKEKIEQPILPLPREEPAELSFAQLRLWFLHQLEPDNTAYNISSAIRIKGPLKPLVLEQSVNRVIQRHETLRTTFATVEGHPVPVVTENLSFNLPVLDLRHQPENARESHVLTLVRNDNQQPFDLTQGPLLRAMLIHVREEEYIFLVSMHHIVSDEWSVGLFIREIGVFYEALLQGKDVPLPELAIQYTDFAYWQRRWLQGDVLAGQLNYWQEQLHDSPPLLPLPADRPRPLRQSYQGATQLLDLSPDLTVKLKALCQREDVTLFMMLLAAFQTLLHRYSGQEDILVGSPIANRNRVELESLIGFFANTLVLRTDFSGNPTFQELLSRVREVALGAYTHQDLPFEMLVEKLQPERNLSHHPLFQVMFVFQYTPLESAEALDLIISPVDIEHNTAKFDLTLFMEDTSRGLKTRLEYNTDLFDSGTIDRMLDHFQVLLQGIVATGGEARVSELPLLTDMEQHQLLVEWNDTQTDYPQQCLHQLFEAQVERTPDEIAVVFGEERLTYRALNERANQLAHHLRKLGVGPECLVGICVERSIEMMVGVLGILKAGGAYVPLNPDDPAERLDYMLRDAQVSVLLTQQGLELPENTSQFVFLDTDYAKISNEDVGNPDNQTTIDNLAYVIYTSGSTGHPKGVMIPHRGVVNYLTWCAQTYPIAAGEGMPVNSSISFDLSVTSVFLPLLAGRTVFLLPNDLEIDAINSALQSNTKFSLIKLTPSHLELLRPQLSALEMVENTKAFIIGGENLPAETAALCQNNTCDTILVNEYGPTEATVGCCVYELPKDTQYPGSIPIGRPIANTQVYLLDRNLQPVPVGVPGELYVSGAGLARGYLNQPRLTGERFIRNPFSKEPAARLYKTGDLARYLPDGNIEFLGRLDNQVKLRGFRIELGEIEAILQQHEAVQEAVVIIREDTPGDKRLVAYVVPDQNDSPAPEDLDYFLRQKLPVYMFPASVVYLEALPLASSGKVNRQGLPPPDQASIKRGSIFVAPRDSLEIQLTEIWEEVLGVHPVSVNDNFFDLGGHSLLAVRLFALMEEAFGKSMPVSTLFQSPTVAQLANVLRKEGWLTTSSLVAIQAEGSRPPFYCVHGMGGGVLDYIDLAYHLGADQPFYGLQERGFDDVHEPFTSIEAMAGHYIREIQTFQPKGPYYLGGYCYGGTVAFEMARQLHRQGQRVALLAIIDNTAPNLGYYSALWKPNNIFRFLKNIPSWLRDFRQLSPPDMMGRIARKMRIMAKDVRNMVSADLDTSPSQADLEAIIDVDLDRIPKKYHKFLRAHYFALRNYTPQPYSGRITLFRTHRYPLLGPFDPQMGWGNLADKGVEVKEITGFHAFILQAPYVQQLARQLRLSLAKAKK